MLCKKHERESMLSIISDFDSVYQIKRRLGYSINGHPVSRDYSEGKWSKIELIAGFKRDLGSQSEVLDHQQICRA
jgi:hypothetical protein